MPPRTIRHRPAPASPDAAVDPGLERQLTQRLRARIQQEGPIPFAQFMELALTDPEAGYYTSTEHRPTREGDYLTAPELHPIFGQCLALQIVEVWDRLGRPVPFTVREYGAGAGTLALAVLEEMERDAPQLAAGMHYEPVEVNPHRLAELRARFAAHSLEANLREPGERFRAGLVIANEYLDALPVHRLVQRVTGLRERYVDWSEGRFVEVEGPVSDPELVAAFRDLGVASPDVVVEIRPGVQRWLDAVASSLDTGVVIVIDYGGASAELFGPHRPEGTAVGYRRHRLAASALDDPGEQDLTAHVDFGDLLTAARRRGFEVLGVTSQAAFLMGCGLEPLVRRRQSAPSTTLQDLLALRSAVRRLLDPRLLGGFRVALLGRGVAATPPLRGLAHRLPTRTSTPRR